MTIASTTMNNLRVSKAIAWTVCGLAVGGFVWECHKEGVLFDDAFITYRYARNLLQGEGFVYNPSEYVNGMYSLLWALLVACGLALKLEAETVGYALGLVFGSATLLLTFLYANTGLPRKWIWISSLAPWVVLSSTSFPLWASSGMGVPLLSFCVTGALMAVSFGRQWCAIVAAIAALLARPEGIVVAIVIIMYALKADRKLIRQWTVPTAVYGLSLIGFALFHLSYFGTPMPSSDYGFVVHDIILLLYPYSFKGLSSVYNFFATGALLLVGPSLLAVIRHRRHRPAVIYCIVAVAYSVFITADTWRNSPFLSSALPGLSAASLYACIASWNWNKALSLSALGSVATAIIFQFFGDEARYAVYAFFGFSSVIILVVFLRRGNQRRLAIAVSSCLCLCAFLQSLIIQKPIKTRWPILEIPTRKATISTEKESRAASIIKAASVAKRLAFNITKPLVATDVIGRVGYTTGYPIIDLVGRVDPTIGDIRRRHPSLTASLKTNALAAKYLLRRKPDYILVGYDSNFDKLMAKSVVENRDFRSQYSWDSVLDAYIKRKKLIIGQPAINARLRTKPKAKLPDGRPNIVLISVDTLRADHLDSYGYFRRTAPHLSTLAKEGILFKRAISQAPWTLPSMATIMTSLYPFEHRAIVARARLDARITTVAEMLRSDNYYTMGVVSNYFVCRKQGFAQGFKTFDENVVKIEDQITSKIITQISREILASVDQEPFFFWAHYMDPHYTYIRHPEYNFATDYRGRFGDRITTVELLNILSAKKTNAPIRMAPEDFTYLRAVYDEEIAFTDAAIGRLISFIRKLDFAHPTVFIIVADHGDFLGEHDEFGHKEYMYDELIHVPLIIGGEIDPSLRGKKVDEIVENRFVPTTIMKLARISDHSFTGNDLIEVAKRIDHESEAYSETVGLFTKDLEEKAAISFGKWKLIYNRRSKTYELYNIDADKGEQHNLWRDRGSTKVSGHLKSRLDAFVRRIDAKQHKPNTEFELSPRQEKVLRALGYIE